MSDSSEDVASSERDDRLDSLHARYRRKIDTIAGLPDLGMQSAAVRNAVIKRDVRLAAWWLDQLLRGAIWGRRSDIDVIVACAYWLIHRDRDEHYEFFRNLYEFAHEKEASAILFMLRELPPHQEMPEEAKLPEVRLPLDRDDITIGERRTLARRRDKDVLERLCLDRSPLVIRNLLKNPRLTERDVILIASRRPTRKHLLDEVTSSRRWFKRTEVRKTLLMNPYNATGVALKLLPTVGLRTLRQIVYSSDVHPVLKESAELLVELRERRTAPWKV